MADCASRIVPPPIVPTSIEGMETLICKLPLLLVLVSFRNRDLGVMTYFFMMVMQLPLSTT
jgi:hypothetical protein